MGVLFRVVVEEYDIGFLVLFVVFCNFYVFEFGFDDCRLDILLDIVSI